MDHTVSLNNRREQREKTKTKERVIQDQLELLKKRKTKERAIQDQLELLAYYQAQSPGLEIMQRHLLYMYHQEFPSLQRISCIRHSDHPDRF